MDLLVLWVFCSFMGFLDNLKLFRLEVMQKLSDSNKKEYLCQIDNDFLTAVIN